MQEAKDSGNYREKAAPAHGLPNNVLRDMLKVDFNGLTS
jgi:hypothetical protein